MIRFKPKTIAASALLAIGTIAVTAQPASADVGPTQNGGIIINQSGSQSSIIMWNGSGTYPLRPGYVSRWYNSFKDVDAINLLCPGWSTDGYYYKANTWYYYGSDNTFLSIKTTC